MWQEAFDHGLGRDVLVSTRPVLNARPCRTRRAFRVTSSAVAESPWGRAPIPSAASLLRAVAGTVRARLIRRNTGARDCIRARIGSASSPSDSGICGQSRPGQSSRTSRGASSRTRAARASFPVRGSGACPAPVNTPPGSAPDPRRWPIISARPSSAPPIHASERRRLSAPKTRSRIAARHGRRSRRSGSCAPSGSGSVPRRLPRESRPGLPLQRRHAPTVSWRSHPA